MKVKLIVDIKYTDGTYSRCNYCNSLECFNNADSYSLHLYKDASHMKKIVFCNVENLKL